MKRTVLECDQCHTQYDLNVNRKFVYLAYRTNTERAGTPMEDDILTFCSWACARNYCAVRQAHEADQ